MKAVFVNDSEQNPVLAPSEVVKAFLAAYDPESVKEILWELFRAAALGGVGQVGSAGTQTKCQALTIEDAASLLDQLIALVEALDALNQAGGAPFLTLINQEGATHV
jgi:hypothetical protein